MFPVFDFSRILEWTATTLKDVAKWALMRAFVLSVMFTVVPVSLYYAWLFLSEKIMGAVTSTMDGSSVFTGAIFEITGLGGWLATQLKIGECFTVLASAMSFVFVMRMIKR